MAVSFQTNPQLRASKGGNEEAHPQTYIFAAEKSKKGVR
jgi:hypothetical protein